MGRRRRDVKDNDDADNTQAKKNKGTTEPVTVTVPVPVPEKSGEMAAEDQGRGRLPLSEVILDCSERWFQDTLKEAKAGDVNMQVLVGQMYYSGYGVPKDVDKGKFWITKASRVRSSAWKIRHKRPGYNVSDSDSDLDLDLDSDSDDDDDDEDDVGDS